MRPCHSLKGNKGTEAAGNWIFFDCETWPAAVGPSAPVVRHTLRLGVAYGCRLDKGRRISEQTQRFSTAAQFWTWVQSRLSRHRPTWIVAHNLSFDWPIVDGFSILSKHGLENWRLILGPPVTIFRGKIDGCSVVVVDLLNYLRASIEELGRWRGTPKGVMPAFTAAEEDWYRYCEQDVRILADSVLGMVALHREGDLGVLGRTLAQSAMHCYRHKYLDNPIKVHDNEAVLGAERAAYYGGRVECAFVGQYKDEVFQLDVNSLYPSIMRGTLLPCALDSTHKNPQLKWLLSRLETLDGCAQVWIESDTDTYPWRPMPARTGWTKDGPAVLTSAERRARGRTMYVRGSFRTWLCGQELRLALERGHVWRCWSVALYRRAVLFQRYVDYWYGRRLEARKTGDGYLGLLAKGYLTALAGVWAKRAPRYVTAADEIPPRPWAKWSCYDAIAAKTRDFRAVGNVPQEEVEDGEPFDSSPVLAACITAAARVRMRALQALAGAGCWLYEDTDSLMVGERGLDALAMAGEISSHRLGALRCETVSGGAVIRGVKDYDLGTKHILKGIKPSAVRLDGGAYQQWQWDGMRQSLQRHGRPEVWQQLKTIHISHSYTKGRVGPDGWTEPFSLFDDIFAIPPP